MADYLLDEDGWLDASSLKSSWSPAASLPEALSKLPDDDNWKSVRENVPGRDMASADVPIVYVSQQPSELILIDGEPDTRHGARDRASLGEEYRERPSVPSGRRALLLLGRGPLVPNTFARRRRLDVRLQGPAARISRTCPESHPRARVLPSVPGTPQADEAILLAQIPQKATVALRRGNTSGRVLSRASLSSSPLAVLPQSSVGGCRSNPLVC